MGLLFEAYDLLEVWVVNVSIDTEQAFEYSFHDFPEVGRKRGTYKR